MEWPIQGPKALSIQQIESRNWGIALDPHAPRGTRFTLRAAADKRSGSLYWLGTKGQNDLHLRLEVGSLVGQLSVLLRSDSELGQGVGVFFGPGRVSVQEEVNGQTKQLASAACPDIQPRVPFKVLFALMGKQFALAVNGHPLIAFENVAVPDSDQSMVRLVVQDSIKGEGEARSVLLVETPLTKLK